MKLLQSARAVTRLLVKDWHAHKYSLFALPVLLLTTLVVLLYYFNHPGPEPQADTWSYLYVVDRIQTSGQVVNFWRLPGYPLFIVLVYALGGQGNLAFVSGAQAALFILATLEFYALAVLLFQRAWMACLISLFVGTNLPLLSYVKPIMSEALALFLLTSLALVVVCFLSAPRRVTFWLLAGLLLLLLLTRPEWIYLPPGLCAYLLLVAGRRGLLRRLLPHVLVSLALLVAVLGGYFLLNAKQNHFSGITWIQNINDLGKVLQYHMQDDTSPQYAEVARTLDPYVARGMLDPYPILSQQPALSAHYAGLAGQYAGSIILHHPGEFLARSIPFLLSSLTVFYEGSAILPGGPSGQFLNSLLSFFRILYSFNFLFPLCALFWLLLLCWPRLRVRPAVQKMGAVAFLSLCGLVVTTLGAYRGYDYMRIHVPFDPLIILVLGGTILVGGERLCKQLWKRRRRWLAGPTIFLNQVKKQRETLSMPPINEGATSGSGPIPYRSGDFSLHVASLFQRSLPEKLVVRARPFAVILIVIGIALLLGNCEQQRPYSSAELVPLQCHQELDRGMLKGTGVNLLFVTIENRSQEASAATMTIAFPTDSQEMPRIQFVMKTASVPAGAKVWVTVDLPVLPGTTRVLEPVGKILITIIPVTHQETAQQVRRTLGTFCEDPT